MAIDTNELKHNLDRLAGAISRSRARRNAERPNVHGERHEVSVTGEVFPTNSERGCVSKLGGLAKE